MFLSFLFTPAPGYSSRHSGRHRVGGAPKAAPVEHWGLCMRDRDLYEALLGLTSAATNLTVYIFYYGSLRMLRGRVL